MPCMGPNINSAHAFASSKMEQIFKLLELVDPYDCARFHQSKHIVEEHRKSLEKLKEAIREAVWSQHCYDF